MSSERADKGGKPERSSGERPRRDDTTQPDCPASLSFPPPAPSDAASSPVEDASSVNATPLLWHADVAVPTPPRAMPASDPTRPEVPRAKQDERTSALRRRALVLILALASLAAIAYREIAVGSHVRPEQARGVAGAVAPTREPETDLTRPTTPAAFGSEKVTGSTGETTTGPTGASAASAPDAAASGSATARSGKPGPAGSADIFRKNPF